MLKRVVIIGAGLAGSLLCNELVKGFDVFLLERGDRDKIEIPQVNFINKKLAEVPTFCYGGGGTTNLWHNGLIPIKTNDIIGPVFLEVLDDCRKFIDQAASALFFNDKSFQVEYENLILEINALSDKFSAFPHGIDCLIYPKKFQKLTIDPKVKAFYNVTDLDFVFDGRGVRTVRYKSGCQMYSATGDVVIVCAGALSTPEVLSKMMAASDLTNDSAGFGFIDHPTGFVGKVKFKKGVSDVFKKLSAYDKSHYVSRNAVRLKSSCGRYKACAFFRPAMTMSNNLAIYKYKSLLGASSGMDRFKAVLSPRLFHPDIMAEAFEHLFFLPIPGRTFNVLFVGEQKQGPNRVFWKGNGLHVDWSISEKELDIYRQMLSGLKDMLTDLAEEINIETNISDEWLWSMAHHSGTVSMGDTDDALVDRDLRLRPFDNVFVCDGSVIQEHSYANTGLAIAQLAFRLAKHIRDKF